MTVKLIRCTRLERTIIDFEYMTTQPYVDASNPLHPTFAQKTFNTTWIATGATNSKPYVDANNPLHPAFNRF